MNGILESKDEVAEAAICGQCMAGHEEDVPCLSEGAAFMSSRQFVSIERHPYIEYGYEEYQHFLPTENVYPPYSLTAWPFAWLLKNNMHDINTKYNLGIDEEAEENWPRGKHWLQFGERGALLLLFFVLLIYT